MADTILRLVSQFEALHSWHGHLKFKEIIQGKKINSSLWTGHLDRKFWVLGSEHGGTYGPAAAPRGLRSVCRARTEAHPSGRAGSPELSGSVTIPVPPAKGKRQWIHTFPVDPLQVEH